MKNGTKAFIFTTAFTIEQILQNIFAPNVSYSQENEKIYLFGQQNHSRGQNSVLETNGIGLLDALNHHKIIVIGDWTGGRQEIFSGEKLSSMSEFNFKFGYTPDKNSILILGLQALYNSNNTIDGSEGSEPISGKTQASVSGIGGVRIDLGSRRSLQFLLNMPFTQKEDVAPPFINFYTPSGSMALYLDDFSLATQLWGNDKGIKKMLLNLEVDKKLGKEKNAPSLGVMALFERVFGSDYMKLGGGATINIITHTGQFLQLGLSGSALKNIETTGTFNAGEGGIDIRYGIDKVEFYGRFNLIKNFNRGNSYPWDMKGGIGFKYIWGQLSPTDLKDILNGKELKFQPANTAKNQNLAANKQIRKTALPNVG